MLTCQFCSETGTIDDFELDTANGKGFWCCSCDGFTYFENTPVQHKFTLILEDKRGSKPKQIGTNRTKFRKQLSPLRYPGGKSKLIDYLSSYIQIKKCKSLISPFTGGGSFELALLDAGVVENLHLNDLDTGVYSLWWTILYSPYELVERIRTMTPTHKDYFLAQVIIKNDFYGVDAIDAAWATLLVNRLSYSGISTANPLGGKNGSSDDLLTRWNPKALIRRIKHIHSMATQITVSHMDAIELIEEAYWDESCTIFIDPPYVQKGKDLYNCYYSHNDHLKLSFLLDSLHQGMPGADLIVTYDFHEMIQHIYQYPTQEVIGRKYSI